MNILKGTQEDFSREILETHRNVASDAFCFLAVHPSSKARPQANDRPANFHQIHCGS